MATQTVNATLVARRVATFGQAKRLQGVFQAPTYSVQLHTRACALVMRTHTRMLDALYPWPAEYTVRLP